jgi:hypothetical protein
MSYKHNKYNDLEDFDRKPAVFGTRKKMYIRHDHPFASVQRLTRDGKQEFYKKLDVDKETMQCINIYNSVKYGK